MVTPDQDWLGILKAQVAKSNISQVAEKIGYARSSVSLALNGKYVGSTDKMASAVVATFSDDFVCPFLGSIIDQATCDKFQTRPIPQSNAMALRHWRKCQTCEHSHTKGAENA